LSINDLLLGSGGLRMNEFRIGDGFVFSISPRGEKYARMNSYEKVASNSYLEIHEWGVIAGCEHNDTYFVTSRPEIMAHVLLPVVYVHAEGVNKLDWASFRFEKGDVTDSYPRGVSIPPTSYNRDGSIRVGGTIEWEDVIISDECAPENYALAFGERVPLEDLKPALNDVDSDCLEYNGQRERFLFYEGTTPFENNIDVSLDIPNLKVTFKNNGSYKAYNVMLSHQEGDFMNASYYTFFAGDLAPGEEQTVTLPPQDPNDNGPYRMSGMSTYGLLKDDMASIGFTQKESEAFADIWDGPFFNPSNTGFTNLIYRLPQIEYERMLPVSISPAPDKFIRSMYVLVDLSS